MDNLFLQISALSVFTALAIHFFIIFLLYTPEYCELASLIHCKITFKKAKAKCCFTSSKQQRVWGKIRLLSFFYSQIISLIVSVSPAAWKTYFSFGFLSQISTPSVIECPLQLEHSSCHEHSICRWRSENGQHESALKIFIPSRFIWLKNSRGRLQH